MIVGRDGGRVRGVQQKWAHSRLREGKAKPAPAGAGAGGKEVVEAVGDEDSAGRGSTATFDPVTLFRCGVSPGPQLYCTTYCCVVINTV